MKLAHWSRRARWTVLDCTSPVKSSSAALRAVGPSCSCFCRLMRKRLGWSRADILSGQSVWTLVTSRSYSLTSSESVFACGMFIPPDSAG